MSTITNEYDDDAIVNPCANPHFDTLLAARLSRRQALGGMGAATGALLGALALPGCGGNDFSSPDGLYFDQRAADGAAGLLWIQTDDGAYTDVTNGMMLAALPGQVGDGAAVTTREGQATRKGADATADSVRRFLVGPVDCEITGVVVTPDGKTLFVNVQHPGEDKGDFTTNTFTSHWPGNQAPASDSAHHGHKRPRSATVVITRRDGGPIAL